MILVDSQIHKWATKFHGIKPYEPEMLNPASIDMRAGVGWIDVQYPHMKFFSVPMVVYQLTVGTMLHNAWVDMMYKAIRSDKLLYYRKPTALLITTFESVSLPRNMCAQIKLKTTPCREGLGHPIADWVDNGFLGNLTLMITANKTISIMPGDRICQLVLHQTITPNETYDKKGHYHNQTGVTASWRLDDEDTEH